MKTLHKLFGIFSIGASLFAAAASEAATLGVDGVSADQSGSNWREWLVGGIQNRATVARNWLMPLPAAHCATRTSCDVLAAWKGGAGGSSSAIGYAVNASGGFTTATPQRFQGSTLGQQKLGTLSVPSGGFVLVVASLAGASSSGGTDGGGLATAELN
jgi:hypothetical protein